MRNRISSFAPAFFVTGLAPDPLRACSASRTRRPGLREHGASCRLQCYWKTRTNLRGRGGAVNSQSLVQCGENRGVILVKGRGQEKFLEGLDLPKWVAVFLGVSKWERNSTELDWHYFHSGRTGNAES